MANSTARQKVLAYLEGHVPASAAEIGRALSMSAPTVRHHLSILAADGRVVMVAGTGTKAKSGRPEKLYRLSDRVLGHNLGLLADTLLSLRLPDSRDPRRQAVLQQLADGLIRHIGGVDGSLPLAKQVVQLTEKLNGLRYRARWEAGASGPRILFGHCPYAEIIAGHPELCVMDAMLLETEMNAQVEQLAKIDRTAGGAKQCIFALRPKA